MKRNNNDLINKRRKKKATKRIIFLIMILISILITLCLKLSFFNIKDIIIMNNKNVTSTEIEKLSKIYKGNNIFYINTFKSATNIKSNPYILETKIKRILPDKIQISVKERDSMFFCKKDSKSVIIDGNAYALEERDNTDGMNLIRIDGIDASKCTLGKIVTLNDEQKTDFLINLSNLIKRLHSNSPKITSIDIGNLSDIKINFNNMSVLIGGSSDLEIKLNKAMNIIKEENLIKSKGYIDVSFKGNPVVKVEK